MRKLINIISRAIGFGRGNSETTDIFLPAKFTEAYIEKIHKAQPNIHVEVIKDLELIVSLDDKKTHVFLYNAYDEFKIARSKDAEAAVFEKYAAICFGFLHNTADELNLSQIIPVIKDRGWIEHTRQVLIERGAETLPDNVVEDFNSDLIIVYAEDTPNNIRYFELSDLQKLNVDKAKLRSLACENLQRLLPSIEIRGSSELYMLIAGGTYETSLLLFDSIWSNGQSTVNGEIVVAIPCRDMLLVTGSQDLIGMEKIKKLTKDAWENGAHRLTPKLFVYRGGTFEVFLEFVSWK